MEVVMMVVTVVVTMTNYMYIIIATLFIIIGTNSYYDMTLIAMIHKTALGAHATTV